jgi:hypothetical protein
VDVNADIDGESIVDEGDTLDDVEDEDVPDDMKTGCWGIRDDDETEDEDARDEEDDEFAWMALLVIDDIDGIDDDDDATAADREASVSA